MGCSLRPLSSYAAARYPLATSYGRLSAPPAKCHFFIAVKDGSRNPSPVQDYRYINDTFIGTAEDLFVIGQNNGIPTVAW
jgi:hypothetical protein